MHDSSFFNVCYSNSSTLATSAKSNGVSSTVFIDDDDNTFLAKIDISGHINYFYAEDFFNLLEKNVSTASLNKSMVSQPFPVSIRYLSNDVFVLEKPPFKASIRFSSKRTINHDKPLITEVWIPWTVWFFARDRENNYPYVKLFFNDAPLSSLDEYLPIAFTSNIYNDARICWGETDLHWRQLIDQGLLNPDSIPEVSSFLINEYFSGGWNNDLSSYTMSDLTNPNNLNPFNNMPVLEQRAAERKVKIRKIVNESSRTINFYNRWSLLSLEEVFESVAFLKEKNKSTNNTTYYKPIYNIKNILESFQEDPIQNDVNFVEKVVHKSIKSYAKKSYNVSDSLSVKYPCHFKVTIDYSVVFNYLKNIFNQIDFDSEQYKLIQEYYCSNVKSKIKFDFSNNTLLKNIINNLIRDYNYEHNQDLMYIINQKILEMSAYLIDPTDNADILYNEINNTISCTIDSNLISSDWVPAIEETLKVLEKHGTKKTNDNLSKV